MKNTEGSDGSGLLLLIAGAVVLSVVSFVLAHLRTILLVVLVAAVLLLLGRLLRAVVRSRRESAAGGRRIARRTVERTVQQARRTAEEDMRTAWIQWQLGVLPPQQQAADASFIAGRLAVVPRADWDVTRLRRHGQALWSVRDAAARTSLHPEVEARLDRVAAVISDLAGEEFDTGLGQTDDQYLYHPDRRIRAAYLEGGARGVDAIMDAITAARARAREDAAAKAAADSLAQQRNAALKALREIRRPTGTRDAHAAWEAEAEQIGR